MSTWALDRLVPSPGVWTFDRLVDISGTPTITSLGTVRDGAAVTITLTGGSVSGNSVFMLQGQNVIQLPIATESPTAIVTTALDTSGIYLTQPVAIYITNSSDVPSNAVAISVLPVAGQLASAITQSFLGDPSTRASASPDLNLTDEIRVKNVVGGVITDMTVTSQGAFVVKDTITAFDYAVQDGAGLSDFVTATWTIPPTLVSPPNLGLKTKAQALSAAQAAGFTVSFQTPQASATVGLGLVLTQFPSPDALVAPGGVIEVTLSLGTSGTVVPNFIGRDYVSAELLRMASGLTGRTLPYIDGNNSGTVVNQSVISETIVPAGTAVDITRSSNQAPSVSGTLDQTAEAILTAANLTVGTVTSDVAGGVANFVSSQSPVGGAVVSPLDTVNLETYTGIGATSDITVSGATVSGGEVSDAEVSGPGVSDQGEFLGTVTFDRTDITFDRTDITFDM